MFVFINYSRRISFNQYHGKAIAIDIDDRHAPFPSIFLIQEMRVRGHNPFAPISLNVPNEEEILYQDWLYREKILLKFPNSTSELFKRKPPSDDDNGNGSTNDGNGGDSDGGGGGGGSGGGSGDNDNRRSSRIRNTRQQATVAGTSSSTQKLEDLNPGVIADILSATHAMPSWKACQMENTTWGGTAVENIEKYVSVIGVEESLSSNAAERRTPQQLESQREGVSKTSRGLGKMKMT